MSAPGGDERRMEARASLAVAALIVAAFVGTCFGSAEEPRWRARYSATSPGAAPVIERWEHRLRFEWANGSPDPGIPANGFSARFETCLALPEARRVAFLLTSDDDASLDVDGERVLDLPGVHPATTKGVEVELDAGTHLLIVDYREVRGRAMVGLSASLDGRAPGPIPNERLRRPENGRCPEER